MRVSARGEVIETPSSVSQLRNPFGRFALPADNRMLAAGGEGHHVVMQRGGLLNILDGDADLDETERHHGGRSEKVKSGPGTTTFLRDVAAGRGQLMSPVWIRFEFCWPKK